MRRSPWVWAKSWDRIDWPDRVETSETLASLLGPTLERDASRAMAGQVGYWGLEYRGREPEADVPVPIPDNRHLNIYISLGPPATPGTSASWWLRQKTKARRTAERRGHALGNFATVKTLAGAQSASAACVRCSMPVVISGQAPHIAEDAALRLPCRVPRIDPAQAEVRYCEMVALHGLVQAAKSVQCKDGVVDLCWRCWERIENPNSNISAVLGGPRGENRTRGRESTWT